MTINPVIDDALKTLDECVGKLVNIQGDKSSNEIMNSINYISSDVSDILKSIEPISKDPKVLPNYTLQLCKNMLFSMDNVKKLMEEGSDEEALLFLRCESQSILKMLRREIDFFYNKAADENRLKKYFEEDEADLRRLFITEKKDPEGEFPYELSIVVLFYNNKDITKACIDSIIEYSREYSYELVTVNNGSDEETSAWAESLPHKKKINLRYNIGASRGGTLALMSNIMDGRFTVYLSNDTIVTENWLRSLVECIKSDPRIAYASPVYNSSSNRQAIPVSYTSMEEMQLFAASYNKPNPLRWEVRARLFGIVMICRPWVFEKLGGLMDLYFSYDMFADDDLCVKLNRAGYRMVLCCDTFVHHCGSATLGERQFELLEKGRRQFYDKYSFDSWSALGERYAFFPEKLSSFEKGPVDILAVNPQYGEEFLMLKNTLKGRNITNASVDVFNMDKKFQFGLENIADRTCYAKSMAELESFTAQKQYDIIMLCEEAAGCFEIEIFLRKAVNILKPDGRIFMTLDNMYSRNVFYNLILKRNLSDDYGQKALGRKAFISLNTLLSFTESLGLTASDIISLRTYCNRIQGIEEPFEKVLNLEKIENSNCFNTGYYALTFKFK